VETSYFIGLDLGQSSEYTALAVVEQTAIQVNDTQKWAWHYGVRYLERFPLGTPYCQVLNAVLEMVRQPILSTATLVMDQTSVGGPIVRLFRQSDLCITIRPVKIVIGHDRGFHDGCFNIPKRELASALQLVLQDRRLKIAGQLDHAGTLTTELQNFRLRVTALSDESNAWREREHDDLVFAVGVAVWMAERAGAPYPETPVVADKSVNPLDEVFWDWMGVCSY
jgi:hypothetical protein